MAAFKIHKVVSVLPQTLQADAVYLVRVGAGFDLYVSDSTGAIAHKVNQAAGGTSSDRNVDGGHAEPEPRVNSIDGGTA